MTSLHRELKAIELRQAWRRDRNQVISRYIEATTSDGVKSPPLTHSVDEMIRVIIEHEAAELTTARVLKSIAA
jgi:hypothetical protein